MKLHSPSFEETLRRGVRKAVASSPKLKREFREHRHRRRDYHAGLLLRLFISAGLGMVLYEVLDKTHHVNTGLAAIGVWLFVLIFFRAQSLRMHLYASNDLPALSLLPLSGPEIFRWQLWKSCRSSLASLVDLIVAFSVLASFAGLSVEKCLALVPILILSWLMLQATTILCVARLPWLPYPLICSVLLLGTGAMVLARGYLGGAAVTALDQAAPTLIWMLPTNWPVSLFLTLSENPIWVTLGLLFPIGLVLSSVPNSLARLRRNYEFHETVVEESADLIPEETTSAPAGARPATRPPQRLGLTGIEEIIQSRKFLAGPTWPQAGWFEQRLWKSLNDRQRALAEFIFPRGILISSPWKKIVRNLAITAGLYYLAGLADADLSIWILGAGLFVTFCQVLGVMFSVGFAFKSIFCSGVNIPIYAAYPVGYWETSGVLIKCSLVQLPMVIAFALVCSALVAPLTSLSMPGALVVGFKAGVMTLSMRFIFIALAFSSGTNDTGRIRFRSLIAIIAMVGCGGLYLLFGALGLFLPDVMLAWLFWWLALLDACAFFAIYGWFYHANRFDLMSLPRR